MVIHTCVILLDVADFNIITKEQEKMFTGKYLDLKLKIQKPWNLQTIHIPKDTYC